MNCRALALFLILFSGSAIDAAGERRTDYLMGLSLEELLDTPLTASTKTATSLRDAPSVVTVFSKAELDRMGVRTLEDVLSMVPGITTGRSNQGFSNQLALHVRGSYNLFGESVLVLIDGQRVNDPSSGGAFAFTRNYPVHQFRQIEVVRGPGSAVFGANAFLAVINLVTHQENIYDFLELDVGGGNLDAFYSSLNYGRRFSENLKFSFSAHASQSEFGRYEIPNITQTVPTPFGLMQRTFSDRFGTESTEMATASANLVVRDWRLNFSYRRHRDRDVQGLGLPIDGTYVDLIGLQHTGLDSDDQVSVGDSEVLTLGLKREVEHSKRLSSSYALTFLDYSGQQTYRGVQYEHLLEGGLVGDALEGAFQTVDQETQTLNADAYIEYVPTEQTSIVVGANYLHDRATEFNVEGRGKSDPSLPFFDIVPESPPTPRTIDAARDIYALYGQFRWKPGQLVSLTAGIRGDHYSDFGSTVNPRLGLVLSPNSDFSLKLLAGTAFRAPTFIESQRDIALITQRNPDLEPETIETYEIQANWAPSAELSFSLAGYTYEIEDVIRQTSAQNPDAPNEQRFVNAGRRQAYGVEAELSWVAPRVVSGSVSYFNVLRSEDELAGATTDIEGVPHSGAGLVLNFNLPNHVMLSVNGYSRWDFVDAAPIPLVPGYNFFDGIDLPSHTIVNLSFTKGNLLGSKIDLVARVHNVFDERRVVLGNRFFHPAGIRTDERQVLLGVRFAR